MRINGERKKVSDKFFINLKYALRWHKPILILRLLIRMIELYVFKMTPLRYVDYAIGYRCNLNCEHCFAKGKRDPKRGRMPPWHWVKIVKECMALGAVNFSFQGGEPLIYKDLPKYIRSARPWANLISVTTNGALLDYKKCRELRKWGVDIITLSVDPYRKNANWHSIIETAKKAGLNVTIGTVITNDDVNKLRNKKHPDLKGLIHYARMYKTILMLIFAVPMGGFEGKEVLLTEENADYVRDLAKKVPYVRTDFQANYLHEGCGAGKEILFINPYGDVLPCPYINIAYGNLRYQSIKKIRRKMLCDPKFRKYCPRCIAGEGKGLWGEFSLQVQQDLSAE